MNHLQIAGGGKFAQGFDRIHFPANGAGRARGQRRVAKGDTEATLAGDGISDFPRRVATRVDSDRARKG